VFWNASGILALPASAVKSVLSPDSATEDYQSNLYRIIENINTMYTIKSAPFQGVGFGKKFFIVRRMPDISHFIWWEYMTHNSIMWMWMKTGLGGFLAMLILIGAAIINGVRTIFRMPGDMMSVAALVATLYVVMHFTYAYVDISWDSQSMIYIGAMIGLINCLVRIVETPVPLAARRWPWQSHPQPPSGLRSL
jgi:O-antigen ligase